jgi:membrane protein
MLAGVVTGTAFLAIQFLYVNGQISLAQYNAVYGSFAAIPLLLFWLQISWLIVLYGAELCYVSQNLINFSFESDTKNISRRYKDYTLFVVLKIIINRFCQAQEPISANQIAVDYNIPIRLVHDHLKLLVDTNIISEIYIEQNAERFYQPALDVNLITVHLVLDRINRLGSENFKITDNGSFKEIWQKLETLQETITAESSKILVRDL